MPSTPKILAFAGSLRKDSYNKALARLGGSIAEQQGAEVVFADLLDYPMPIYNEDDENAGGIPDTALAFRELMKSSDAFLIASPEYNGAPSGLMKNVIDWASRPRDGEAPLECFTGKTAALVATSPGRLGGIRGLPILRTILSGIGVNVLAKDFALPGASDAFTGAGELAEDGHRKTLEAVVTNLVTVTRAVKG